MPSTAIFDLDISTPGNTCTYHIDGSFWNMFEHSLIKQGELTADIKVIRNVSDIVLVFNVQGVVELSCDRSLEIFGYPVVLNREVVFKLGHENKEIEEDLYMLTKEANTINVAQHIYDFISLAVPMKKIHPKFMLTDE